MIVLHGEQELMDIRTKFRGMELGVDRIKAHGRTTDGQPASTIQSSDAEDCGVSHIC